MVPTVEVVVVAGVEASLLGRDWLCEIRLDWHKLNQIQPAHFENLKSLSKPHDRIFKDKLGLVKAFPEKIHLEPSAKACFCRL